LQQARKVIREMEQRAQADEGMDERQKAAQKRAAEGAVERAKAALEKMKKLEAAVPTAQRAGGAQDEAPG
jgi:hypothetical protein